MKSIYFLLLAILWAVPSQLIAQTSNPPTWIKSGSSRGNEASLGLTIAPNGDHILVGNFDSVQIKFGNITVNNYNNASYFNMFVTRYDSLGNVKWAKGFGSYNDDYIEDVATDASGNVFITGTFKFGDVIFGNDTLKNIDYFDIFVAKLDPNGVPLWAKSFGGNDYDVPYNIAVDENGNSFITGYFESDSITFGNTVLHNSNTYEDFFIAKLDPNGNPLWAENGGGSYRNVGNSLSLKNNTVYVTGSFESSSMTLGNTTLTNLGVANLFIAAYNTQSGALKWAKSAGGTKEDIGNAIVADSTGHLYLTGYLSSPTAGFDSHTATTNTYMGAIFIAKYDTSGNNLWVKAVSTSTDYDMGTSIVLDKKENPIIGGYFSSNTINFGNEILANSSYNFNLFNYDIFVAKFDKNGSNLWLKSATGKNKDYLYDMALSAGGNLSICGHFFSDTLKVNTLSITNSKLDEGSQDVFVCNGILFSNMPEMSICAVTTDSAGLYNEIYWDKSLYPTAEKFLIYRETSANNYKLIGEVPKDSLSMFVDTVRAKYFPYTGNPNAGTYRYKLQMQDIYGSYSLLSPFHNTLYIADNGLGLFNWTNSYTIENTPVPVNSYILLRDDANTGIWHAINAIAGTQSNLNDPDYQTYKGIANWRVEIDWNRTCTAQLKTSGIMAKTITKSRSNIKSYRIIGIKEFNGSKLISIFPQPATHQLTLKYTGKGQVLGIKIYNTLGEEVYNLNTTERINTVSLENLSPGVYTLQLHNEEGAPINKTFVKE